ncbi:unnamed protein product [Trichobilharzia regenti]|nr:unnamed protein product [Trichobilharzia regenti]
MSGFINYFLFNNLADTYAPTSALVNDNIIKKDASIETETYFDGPICSKVELNHLETSVLSKHSGVGEEKPEEGAEVSKLRVALMESSKEIEEYKQLTDDLRTQGTPLSREGSEWDLPGRGYEDMVA